MPAYLTTGGADDPFLPKLLHAIQRATEIDLAVAFIKSSGLGLIFDALAEAVTLRGARLRLLTSDYLDVTDPDGGRFCFSATKAPRRRFSRPGADTATT